MNSLPKNLIDITIKLPSDFKPFGQRCREENYGPDCSCNCKYFLKLENNKDFGICTNRQSPRKGMLTFEHQGCSHFEEKDNFMD